MSTPRCLSRWLRAAAGAACLAAVAAQAAPDNEQFPFDTPATAAAPMPAAAAVPDKAPEPAAPAGLADRMRDKASDAVLTAMNFLGVPYRRGGNSADSGFDCSGFTRHIFEMSLGKVLPRRVDDQASAAGLVKVDRHELKPGDLVFFNTLKRTFSHVGIYVGEGKFIHSPRTGGSVRVEDMRFAYWAKRFTGARRMDTAMATSTDAGPQAR